MPRNSGATERQRERGLVYGQRKRSGSDEVWAATMPRHRIAGRNGSECEKRLPN